jgi:DNA (cytosine-5)-methyltransferase 1
MENVLGILDKNNKKRKREHLLGVIADLLLLDYQVRLCVCKASDYGDAQDRERVILFAARRDYKLPRFPRATHGDLSDMRNGNVYELRKTAQDILGDLETIQPSANGMVTLQNGKEINDHGTDGTNLGKNNDMQLLVAKKPVKTVRRSNPMKHYCHERCLTVREYARVQSLPDDFQFAGTHTQQRTQIGNAVPLNLGRAVARAVMAAHQDYRNRWNARSNH